MKSRTFFVWFFICAAIPLIAAQVSLSLGWFSGGSTNKGEWLAREIQLLPDMRTKDVAAAEHKNAHWRLVYVQADSIEQGCDQRCEQALVTLQQLYSGLGRKQLKIKPLLMALPSATSPTQPEALQQFPDVDWQLGQTAAPELQGCIVIVNQQGLALLRYPVKDTPEQMRDLAKNIRTDLLHLINYDRSGV